MTRGAIALPKKEEARKYGPEVVARRLVKRHKIAFPDHVFKDRKIS